MHFCTILQILHDMFTFPDYGYIMFGCPIKLSYCDSIAHVWLVSLQSPNAVYRFTATNPPNCVQSTCDYFLGIRTNDNDPTYLDFVLEGSATGWIAVGFAQSSAMVM